TGLPLGSTTEIRTVAGFFGKCTTANSSLGYLIADQRMVPDHGVPNPILHEFVFRVGDGTSKLPSNSTGARIARNPVHSPPSTTTPPPKNRCFSSATRPANTVFPSGTATVTRAIRSSGASWTNSVAQC